MHQTRFQALLGSQPLVQQGHSWRQEAGMMEVSKPCPSCHT